MIPAIAYGGDYNPEQWTAETVDRDIELMHEAGVNLVSVGIFSWAVLQPTPGVFDFGWLDTVMDKLHDAGIAVDLATATASPPPWLGHLHPDTLPVTRDGVRLSYGSRQQFNPSSATFRRESLIMVRAIAERYAKHPALKMWHVNNEYGCHVHESFDEESATAFREWLQARYGTLAELNRVWGTTFWSQRYSDWAQVSAPRAMPTLPNPTMMTDWNRFCSDALLACYTAEKEVLNELTPDVPLTTNFMGAFAWVDGWKWGTEIDIISNDSYPDPSDPRAGREFAFESDLMRSLGGGKPFIQLEQTTSAVQWRPRNAVKRPGQYKLWSLQAVARGADGICQFQWRQSASGAETFHSGMVPHAGKASRTWHEVVELGSALKDIGVVAGSRVQAQAAIVWDWESAWAQRNSIGPVDTEPLTIAKSWHASLFEMGIATDFVHPDHDLGKYQLIIVPSLFAVSDAFAAALARAAANGAQVIVSCLTGALNAEGPAQLGGYLGPLAPLLGVRVLDFTPLGVVPHTTEIEVNGPLDGPALDPIYEPITSLIRTPATERSVALLPTGVDGITGNAIGWVENLEVIEGAGACVLSTFAGLDTSGWPAITRRQHGTGTAWYVASNPDARGRAEVISAVVRESAGSAHPIRPVLAAPVPGIEAVLRGQVLFLLNHADTPALVPGISGTVLYDGGQPTPEGPRRGTVLSGADVSVGPRNAVVLQL
ncbi:beta-galactosidase [Arthrobacter sp. UYCu511]|uniref:beta-galactosidase n=1 Tax=Arthrobacter sp. UYCu511 TaxID=3156337 RepID=UPI0033927A5B